MKPALPSEPALRDIHVPDASWWPPAPGWWILSGLLVVIVGILAWWLRRYVLRQRKLRALEAELRLLEAQFAHDQNKQRLASALSQLLRRGTLLRGGKAQLRGYDWLTELERLAPACLRKESVDVLDSAPYQRHADFDAPALVQDCRRWLQAVVVRSDT